MANFHNAILNIPCESSNWHPMFQAVFKEGFKQARHDAAEIANEADARIEELEKVLRNLAMWAWMNGFTSSVEYFAAEKALAKTI